MNSAHNLVKSVSEIITLPEIYYHISDLINSPDVTTEDFENVLNRDDVLAAAIIKISNSSLFGFSRNNKTVNQAVSMIGILQLHDLLLSRSVISALTAISVNQVDQEIFWRRNIYCGIVAKLLAKKCLVFGGERLFTSGLLHEIGHLVIYAEHAEILEEILFDSQQNKQSLHSLQREKLGYDYGQISSEIMRQWNLSDRYSDIATYHMEPKKAQNNQFEIQLVNLARSIMLEEDLDFEYTVGPLINDATNLINDKLTRRDIEGIKSNAFEYVDELMDCLLP